MGREKLTEERLPASSSSSTCARLLVARCPPRPPVLGPVPLSRLTPLPPPLDAEEPPRNGGSRLEARRCTAPVSGIFAGMAGTGGAFGSAGLPLPGDGLRKVRSVIDPELVRRCSAPGRCWPCPLPFDDCELRRSMRFVTVSPTGGGVVTCVRSAAAAAAFERVGLVSRSLTKAFVAAKDADGLVTTTFWGCIGIKC
jgi:hypothetical protein